MMRPLEIALLQFGGMRQVATILRTGTGAELPIPTLNDTGNTGALLGEGLEHTELDTTFDQLALHAFKYTSRRVPVSVEYLQDNAINFVGRIGSILGERIGRITNSHFSTGDGNAKPNGLMVASTSSGVTTASAAVISYDNIIDLKHSVDPAYREQGARFMFNDTTLKILKKIKVPQYSGDTAGQPLWRAGMAASEPNTIDGDPYTINQQIASGSNARSIAYGLLSKYQIRDVRDVTLVRLDERYAELGVVAFLAFSRHDGDLLDAGTHPVKYMTQGA
jgi:HK97 family phage major capsid protein